MAATPGIWLTNEMLTWVGSAATAAAVSVAAWATAAASPDRRDDVRASGLVLRADRVWGGDGWVLRRGGKLGGMRMPLPGIAWRKRAIQNGKLPKVADVASGDGTAVADAPPRSPPITKAVAPPPPATTPAAPTSAAPSSPPAPAKTPVAVSSRPSLTPFGLFRNHRPSRLPGPPQPYHPAHFR
ncbi:hypothetical protein CDCA_CDCA10G2913 [Cyanidium caldarium]|uniref:Uncharacterized protein n=1 Tax=Cyanidium caldarium TaxID=2771 RepID=A0AAV9IXR7_CYACA|nr:hypothetical protein CDCA_CDCA10G2913 [Cyanidium caldarium]